MTKSLFYILFLIFNIGSLQAVDEFKSKNIFTITIHTIPKNAKVQIMNIVPRYYDGMKLNIGRYKIRVSKTGYIPKVGYVTLDKNIDANITLTKHIKKSKKTLWRDNTTNLTWQVTIDKSMFSFEEAKKYCTNLKLSGFDNWKLPNKKEIMSIVTSKSQENKKIYTGKTYIKKPLLNSMNMPFQMFWSSTSYYRDGVSAWHADFYHGDGVWFNKTNKFYARCVVSNN